MPRSSFRVRRSSVGYSVARKGAELRRVQHSSEGCSVALRAQRSSDMVQRCSDRVQRNSEGRSLALRVNRNTYGAS